MTGERDPVIGWNGKPTEGLTAKVLVTCTPTEKALLERRALRLGFKSLSPYGRVVFLAELDRPLVPESERS